MKKEKHPYVCHAEYAGTLDNWFRRLIHDPYKILSPYVTGGMTVIDLGCGPGYFTVELAKLVGEEGKVIAADLQEGMLEKVISKIKGTEQERRILLHKCREDKTGIPEKADFILAFWMVHEVPDHQGMIRELKSLLNPGGKIFIIEPRIHVTEKSFRNMISLLQSEGLEITETPRICLSRAVLLSVSSLTK